eukprot:COSAG05_NODE_332_length_11268_cov_132.023726_3_plen_155_part_00
MNPASYAYIRTYMEYKKAYHGCLSVCVCVCVCASLFVLSKRRAGSFAQPRPPQVVPARSCFQPKTAASEAASLTVGQVGASWHLSLMSLGLIGQKRRIWYARDYTGHSGGPLVDLRVYLDLVLSNSTIVFLCCILAFSHLEMPGLRYVFPSIST